MEINDKMPKVRLYSQIIQPDAKMVRRLQANSLPRTGKRKKAGKEVNSMKKLPFDLEDMVEFLIEAREHGYQGKGKKEKKPQIPDHNEFYYKKGDFEYRDSYPEGDSTTGGREVILYKGKEVWQMFYNGGMLPQFQGKPKLAKKTYAFLKKALCKVDKLHPFRGPARFTSKKNVYVNQSEGDITRFKGTEKIYHKFSEVFSQDYIGGLIIDKS